ncbi:HlyD family secretion protein [Pseudoalteromonas sp. G4]|uniref:HlyD family secretion protein n=1 Tax=Pseudoalteromonas sp. G4 TaxID=2992761 RepID=UPI00237D3DDC|nr:HlyD family efflux transporter periplasmic adaptor subunit [Pseudoalteromonas sp. G4]MDE3270904.1 HlyD family efflux transporter periplasmic adaptor subunit [Pseudoalteromonas sp. G4]
MKTLKLSALPLMLASALFTTKVFASQNIFITGEIKASDSQTFFAPQSDTWRIQVEWMLPEGEVAKPGDVVVVFEGGSIASNIEQDEVNLNTALDELKRQINQGKQSILEAEFALTRADLLLEKAKIDAAVPKSHLSAFDYEENQLKLEQAVIQKHKAKASLAEKQNSAQVNISKQEIEIIKRLQKLTHKATNQGPILYGNHPWYGTKLFTGVTAQPGWKIAEIPAMTGLYLEAWVHEIDYKHLKREQTMSLTLDAYQDTPLTAKLSDISTQPEERKEWGKDAYYRAKFTFDDTQQLKILPGMTGRVVVQGGSNE